MCKGAKEVVEVANWFIKGQGSCEELRVCRIKNMFARDCAEVVDGYRDLKVI